MRRGQAAPGASLITEPPADRRTNEGAPPGDGAADQQPPAGATRAGRPPASANRLLVVVAVVAVLVVALDQVTKALAVAHLTENVQTGFLGPVLHFDLTRNAGAAFSTATGMTWVLTLIAVAVVVFVVRAARRLGSRLWALAFGLLLGGACGNLTDRLVRAPGFARGHVVDFLEFPHWPIFNLADCSIVCAGVLVVLLTLRGVSWERRPEASAAAEPRQPSDQHDG